MKEKLFNVVWSLSFLLLSLQCDASAELDRSLRLNKMGVLKPADNVDGLFGDLVTERLLKSLQQESRFLAIDLRKTSQTLSASKTPYIKLIEENALLTQIAKSQNLDGIIRSKVIKEGPIYRFQIDFLYGKTAQILATETFQVKDPFLAISDEGKTGEGSDVFKDSVDESMKRLFQQLPFKGMITGRDNEAVTIDMGRASSLKKGDVLTIGSLEEIKEHPLLKKIMDWRFSSVGKIKITQVDETMAFGKIEEEEPGKSISRFQKVLQVIRAPEPVLEDDSQKSELENRMRELHAAPKVGFFSPQVLLGKYSREASTSSGTQGYTGSATQFGFKGESQIWLTSRWFADLSFAYSTGNYSQKDILTNTKTSTSSVSSSRNEFKFGIGYFLPFSEEFLGPKAYVRLGYHTVTYRLPNLASEKLSPTSLNGLQFGLGGDLPFRGRMGALMDLDFGPFDSGNESAQYYGTTSSSMSAAFRVGAYYWMERKLKLQLNIDYKSDSIDFMNGATLSNRLFSVGPSVLLYF